MTEVWRLFQLQKTDSLLMQYSKEIKELQSGSALEKELQNERDLFAQKETALRSAQKNLKEKNHEEATLQSKRKELNSKIYGGTISNPKEIVSYEQELKNTSDKIAVLEVEILQIMEDAERMEQEYNELKDSLELKERDTSQAQGAVDRKIARIQEKVDAAKEQRTQIASGIDPRMLHQYNELRIKKHGVAVAEVKNKCCSGCHMKLTDHKIQEVKDPGISTCGTCRRILFMQT